MLKLRQNDLADLRRHGEETYPHECCGVLLGVMGEEARTDSPENRYSIDPGELVRVQREARERELDIVGFYHSHPDHPALWSPTDFQEAHWIGCSYVITSVEKGKATVTNSFVLTGTTEEDKALVDEEIVVE
jgi:proteasome lid subunit RPN8/RPN11